MTKNFIKFEVLYGVPLIFNTNISMIKTNRFNELGMFRFDTDEQPLSEYVFNLHSTNGIEEEEAKKILSKFNYIEVPNPISIYDIDIEKYALAEDWLKAYELWKCRE